MNHSPPDPRLKKRHILWEAFLASPMITAVAIMSLVIGSLYVVRGSAAIGGLPLYFAYTWGGLLIVGSCLVLWGTYWRTPAREAQGRSIEMSGMICLGISYLTIALAAAYLGPAYFFAVLQGLSLSTGSFGRVYAIHRVNRAVTRALKEEGLK